MNLNIFLNKCLDIFLPKKTSQGVRQFFLYLFCGGVSTIADSIVLLIFAHLLGINYLIAAPIGFVVGVTTNYTLNTMLVFKSQGKIKKELSLFAIIGIGGVLWTELILWILIDKFHFYLIAAKMIAVILVLFWNFFMRKKFVFSSSPILEDLEKSLE